MIDILNKNFSLLDNIAVKNALNYQNGQPFPNIYFDNFFNSDFLDGVLAEFPDLSKGSSVKFNNPNEVKLASKGEYRFGPQTKIFMHYLNSQPFLEFLQTLTGINEVLLPDPYFDGGGCHEIKKGGLLKVHADFNKQSSTQLDRRVNVLVYLNKEWKEEYGGHFELWNKDLTQCENKILPLFNRMAIFSTTDFSYHGHPNALTCPDDRSRKSIALYYFSNGRPQEEIKIGHEDHRTLFVDRKDNNQDIKMKWFNQTARIVEEVMPPFITRALKKMLS